MFMIWACLIHISVFVESNLDVWRVYYFDSAQAHSLDQLLWGRFLVGLGIGANAVLVPIYISEVYF